jgi:hypothetical protein
LASGHSSKPTLLAYWVLVQRRSSSEAAGYGRWWPGTYVVYAIALYTFMPPNPDPVEMPPTLVAAFRGLAFVGLTLFWLVLDIVLLGELQAAGTSTWRRELGSSGIS